MGSPFGDRRQDIPLDLDRPALPVLDQNTAIIMAIIKCSGIIIGNTRNDLFGLVQIRDGLPDGHFAARQETGISDAEPQHLQKITPAVTTRKTAVTSFIMVMIRCFLQGIFLLPLVSLLL